MPVVLSTKALLRMKLSNLAALLCGHRPASASRWVSALAGGRPFVGGIMGQLGEFAIQDQLGPLRQQLGTTQLLAQPADGIPEAKHHDKRPEEMPNMACMEYSANSLNGPVQL